MDATDPHETSTDALEAVSTAARIWRKATAAWPERDVLDRAIVRAFKIGRTGSEIAAAGGLEIADVYRVHKRIDRIKADDDLDAKWAQTGRRTAELAVRLKADPINPTDDFTPESPAITRSSTSDPLRLRWRSAARRAGQSTRSPGLNRAMTRF